MFGFLYICFVILGVTSITEEVSTKLDFGEESSQVKNSSKEDDDVEVKHTIVLSTKLRNNNRRALTQTNGDTVIKDQKIPYKDDSGEVPIIKAYKSVDTTEIRTPDTRTKSTAYPDYFVVNSNGRDEFDLYPNLAANPMQWKPSTFYKNVNFRNQDSGSFDNYVRRNRPEYQNFHKRVTDDGVREFYCNKCRELSGPRGCHQQRRNSWIYETTTSKIKIDGKLAKLN